MTPQTKIGRIKTSNSANWAKNHEQGHKIKHQSDNKARMALVGHHNQNGHTVISYDMKTARGENSFLCPTGDIVPSPVGTKEKNASRYI